MWVGETIADVVGYPLAGMFVASLLAALPLAFWLDAATYLASAVLLATIVVRAEDRERGGGRQRAEELHRTSSRRLAVPAQRDRAPREHDPGRDRAVHRRDPDGPDRRSTATRSTATVRSAIPAVYGFLEAGIGVGNLVGGFAIGLVGSGSRRVG